jgi:hypothetical protein
MQGAYVLAAVRKLPNDPHGVDIRFPIRRLHDLLRLQDIGTGVGIVGDGPT